MNKRLHVYDWDHEPKEERPSTFASTGFESTGFASLSGYHPMMDPTRRTRRSSRIGFKALVLFVTVLLVLGACALSRYAPLLKIS